ncbi:MAG TPA: BA14K family protein [Shinella sp.]|jgi:hypothetical protein|nr:BA14K family protein [Shinella sp.]
MKFISKVLAMAMSALFAATPVVPANAMPLPVAKIQTTATEGGTSVQLVRDHNRRIWRRGGYDRGSRSTWRAERFDRGRNWNNDRRYYRDSRRWRGRDRDVGWRGDRGYRSGWYRGHRGYRYQRDGYRYHNGFWFPLAAFGVGTIVGGAIANDRGYVGGGSHVNWCANRYRSYRAYDNTYQPYGGPRRQCISPYR